MSEQNVPVLSEHEGRNAGSTNPSGYTPSPEEKKAIKLVQRLFEKAKKHRSKYDEHWLDYYKMFRGKQWKEQRPSYRHAEVINFIFQNIQSQIPILTDSRPRFDFLPQEPSDIEFAKILSQVSESDWEQNNWLLKLAENLYDSHFYGAALASMEYDARKKMGLGAICYGVSDPMYCFPDPNATDVNERSEYFIYAEPVDIEILKKEYPDKKDFIKPDLIDLIQGEKTDLDQVRFKSPVDNKTIIEGTSAYEANYRNQALKITAWLKDDDFEDVEKTRPLEDGSEEKYYEQRLKYPNGRKICIASGVLLDDGPNPYDDGLFPYARLVNYVLPREFWGISEVEQLSSPQKIFNKLVSYALDVLVLMGNPIWKVGTGSGVDTDNLFNRPGLIIEAEDISQVQREEGVQLQPYVLQLIDRMQDWFQEVGGRTDVTQGVNPSGVTAASAISSLQEAAQTRIRQKSRNLDAFLQNLGQLYKNRVFQFYSAPRIVRLTNKDDSQKYFKLHIERIEQPEGGYSRKATVRGYTMGEDGRYTEDLEAREYLLRGDFDVKVSTGSSLPFAKAEKASMAFKMMEAGAIDELELLKAVDWPNAEGVYQEVQARQKQRAMDKMQMEAQAAAPPAPPQSPAGPPPAA